MDFITDLYWMKLKEKNKRKNYKLIKFWLVL